MSFKLGHVSIPKRSIFLPLFLFCAYDSSVLQNFKIFIHFLPNVSYKDPRMTEVTYHCINFNDRFRKVPKHFHIVPFVDGSRYKINGPVTTTEFRMHCFNDRVREVPKISPDIILGRYFEIMTRLGTISETSLGFNNRYLLVVVNG
jgi:hypothetical protein